MSALFVRRFRKRVSRASQTLWRTTHMELKGCTAWGGVGLYQFVMAKNYIRCGRVSARLLAPEIGNFQHHASVLESLSEE